MHVNKTIFVTSVCCIYAAFTCCIGIRVSWKLDMNWTWMHVQLYLPLGSRG